MKRRRGKALTELGVAVVTLGPVLLIALVALLWGWFSAQ